MTGTPGRAPGSVPEGVTSVLVRVVARLLLVPAFVVAVAVFVKGYAQPGDGFSAGVVASLGILLQYLAFGRERTERLLPPLAPGVLAFVGLLAALAVAAFPLLLGDPLLTHYPPPGEEPVHLGTLELITAVAFDAGIFLLVFGFSVGAIRLVALAQEDREPEAGDRPEGPA